MKLNRKWLLVIALVMSLTMATAGTLAYLTDRDSEANVFTVGNVEIDLNEDYEHASTLIPGVNIEKKPTITNTGKNDAWVWLEFAIPAALDNFVQGTEQGSSENVIHWNPKGATTEGYVTEDRVNKAVADGFFEGVDTTNLTADYINNNKMHWNVFNSIDEEVNAYTKEINDVDYNVYVLLYNKALTPGEATLPNIEKVYLDARVDIDPEGDWYFVENGNVTDLGWNSNENGNPVIYVSAYAMQKDGFDTVNAAYAAYQTQWGNNGGEYADPTPADVVIVKNLDDLKAVFANGGKAKLAEDITLEKMTPVEAGKEVYLDLNGKTITVDQDTASNTLIWVKDGAKLTVDGNGTIDLEGVSTMAIFCPYGELVIENGTFKRDKVTTVTDATTGLFMGASNSGCNVTINGGYFDPGYYDENAADIEEILAGTKEFTETADDIAKRDKPGDQNLIRVAVKDNVSVVLNHSGYGSFKVYGGTFVGANPAWGDEGCMLPTTPNYLRPWSYYQGALLDGQTFNENKLVIPDGYTITKTVNAEKVPVYTVSYSK